ncbi:MAG: glycosyltransferase family 4 protein [Methanosarcina sp.]
MKKKELNILILLQDRFTHDMPARPAIMEIYGKYLPAMGHKIKWVAPHDSYFGEIKTEYYNDVLVYLIPCSYVNRLYKKIYSHFLYYLKLFSLLHGLFEKESYDIVQVRNDVFSSLIVLFFRQRYQYSFVFQYSFPFVEAYNLKKSQHIYFYFIGFLRTHIQRTIFKKADLLFPISKWMKAELLKKGVSNKKMMPLPMGVNPESFSFNTNGSLIRQQFNLDNSKIVLYVGSMDKLRSLSIIVYAALKVINQYSNVKFLIVGEGNDRVELEKLSVSLGIGDNFLFTGNVPYSDVSSFIAIADICLSPIPPLNIYMVSSPTKLFEAMVMCKPVVANEEIPEQKEILEESGGGILVKFDSESFTEGILRLLKEPESAVKMGECGYRWVVKNRSYKNMALDVEERYYELLYPHLV